MTKKSSILLISLGTLLVIAVTVAVSYALWSITRKQETSNVITSGCFNIEFSELTNEINLPKAYPLTEAQGSALSPFTFKITNTCSIISDYTINLEMLSDTTLNSNFVAVKINDRETQKLGTLPETTKTDSSSTEARKILSGQLAGNSSVTYDLRLWLHQDTTLADDAQHKLFNAKIVVESEVAPTQS
ncbi:MAG: hypothetical protein ACI31M_04340 [Bacilli bacterium]